MQINVDIPDELALRLNPLQAQLPKILELGLREWTAQGESGFSGLADVLEILASLPSAEEILALKPSHALQQQVEHLLAKNKTVGLTVEEECWWQQYEYVEHLVRMAKARALLKLKAS
ncbi:MAG: hypothetical protein F6J87_30875 [Spirulina sp. SIO3F2]|nr:hypothetical protein [Spirulina sp. SIO3F2]